MKKKSHRTLLVLTFGLSYLLGIVGPFSSLNQIYLLFFLALLSIVFNTSRAVDEILVVAVMTLGIVPIFGWVNVPGWFNPIQVIIAAWFCVIVKNWERKLDKPQTILSIIPLTIAPVFSFQWWKGISEGDPVAVLTRILPIWDMSGHFVAFYSNLVDNTYIPRKPQPGENLTWAFKEYPTGVHYVWAQFAKSDKARILEKSELAIPIFANSVVVTFVLVVLIANLSIWRLANANFLRVSFSIICSGFTVALITLGPLSQTITTGFANISPVLIAMCIFLSFALKPHESDRIQLLIIGSTALCMSYNWYPTLLLVAPSFVFSLIRLMQKSKQWEVLFLCAVTSPFVLMPLLQTLTLGIDHIELPGGVQPFPSGILVTILIATGAIGLWASATSKNNLYLVVSFPAPVIALILGIWLRIRTDSYPYYFHKASLFIAAYSFFAILSIVAMISGSKVDKPSAFSLNQKIQIVTAAILMGFGASQLFGYWGFDYAVYSGQSSAYGVLNRNEFVRRNDLNRPSAMLIIDQARKIKNEKISQKSCSVLMIPSEIGALDKTYTSTWKGSMENTWFHALSNSLTTEAQQLSFMTVPISQVANDFKLYVGTIKKTFHPPSTCVITSLKVKSEIDSLPWKSLRVFIE